MAKGKVPPPTKADAKLSKKHLKASIKFNKKHSDDHLAAMKSAAKLLKSGRYFSAVRTGKS